MEKKRAAVRAQRELVLEDAKKILDKYRTPARANQHLKRGHIVQLLTEMGKKELMLEKDGPRKGKLLLLADLRQLFWQHHRVSGSHQEEESEATECDSDSEEDNQSERVPFGVGDKVQVFWPAVKFWYEGVITEVDQADCTYQVHYKHDDQYEWHDMSWETKLVE